MRDLTQLLFSVPDEAAEAVANLLNERIGTGIEQRDGETLATSSDRRATELLVWMPSSDVQRHVGEVERLLSSLAEMGAKAAPWSWRSEEADPSKWIDAYKTFFKVSRLARRTVIKPSWEDYQPEPQDLVIEIDPGQAFGTGLHASTRLVVSALERSARIGPTPKRALDLGCGTGILALVIARLWPDCNVTAVDNDEIAVAAARENVQRNGLARRITVEHGEAAAIEEEYDLVAANLTADVLGGLRPVLRDRLRNGGRLLLSGILTSAAGEIAQLYTHDLSFDTEYSEQDGEWRVLVVRRRA